jgi:hypothetical protein
MQSSRHGGSTVTCVADTRVDAYIDALPDWQQAICRQVRDLVHSADQDVTETVKRTRQPYFVLHGNICALSRRRCSGAAKIWLLSERPAPRGR